MTSDPTQFFTAKQTALASIADTCQDNVSDQIARHLYSIRSVDIDNRNQIEQAIKVKSYESLGC